MLSVPRTVHTTCFDAGVEDVFALANELPLRKIRNSITYGRCRKRSLCVLEYSTTESAECIFNDSFGYNNFASAVLKS
jgi:hypothetical protein